MAVLYVNDGGSGTTPFDTWAKAATTLAAALADAACTAGSTVYVDSTHAETPGATTLSNSGTNKDPIIIISVDATGSPEPPTTGDYLKGATLTVTGAGLDLSFSGHCLSYGVNYAADDWIRGANDATWHFHDCQWKLNTASGTDTFDLNFADSVWQFDKVEFSFAEATQGFTAGGGASVYIKNCTIDGTATKPNSVVDTVALQRGCTVEVDNCDLSNLATNGDIFGILPNTTNGENSVLRASNCLLPTGGSISLDSISTYGTVLEAFNCSSSASESTGYYLQTVFGTVTNDTAVYLDTGDAFSLKMVTTVDALRGVQPLRCMLGEVYAAAGATIAVEGIIDSATLPDDDEFWIEVIYPKVAVLPNYQTATSLHGHGDTGLPTDWFVASTTALGAGTASWTGVGAFGNTGEFTASIDLSATTPTSAAGVVQVWVNWAKYHATLAERTIYVDSKIVVT